MYVRMHLHAHTQPNIVLTLTQRHGQQGVLDVDGHEVLQLHLTVPILVERLHDARDDVLESVRIQIYLDRL